MSELSKKYREIMKEIETRITNEGELVFIKDKLSEISIIFMDIIDRMNEVIEDKIIDIENSQKNIESRLYNLQKTIGAIERDIYDDYEETEIICPYCNNEFTTELSDDNELEIECPECHNIIELDMNVDDIEDELYKYSGCEGFCTGCNRGNSNNNEDDNKR